MIKAIACLPLCCLTLYAQPVKLTWDIVPETNCLGYRLLTGPVSGAYVQTNTVIGRLNNTVTVTNAVSGRAFSVVVAFDDVSESDFSNEVIWTNRIFAPKNLKVSAVLQAAQNVTGPWTNLAVLPLPMTNQTFVRTQILLEELRD